MSDTPVYDNVVNPEPEPGFVERSRKAFVAGASALAGALGAAIIPITGDGKLEGPELIAAGTVALGIGLAAFFLTWQTPNAKK